MKHKWLHIVLCLFCMCFSSCDGDLDKPLQNSSSLHLSLDIASRALTGQQQGTGRPREMKVWVFGDKNDAKDLLYYENFTGDNLFPYTDGWGNPMHTILRELKNGKYYDKLCVHVVLNDGSVTWKDDFTPGEDTSHEDFASARFTAITYSGNYTDDNSQLMYGYTELAVADTPGLDFQGTVEVKRCVAKLELYFTKESADFEVKVKKITLNPNVNYGCLAETPQESNDLNDGAQSVTLYESTDGGAIDGYSDAGYGNFSGSESEFQKWELSNPYLLENPNGLAWTDSEGLRDYVYPAGDGTKQPVSSITIEYDVDGTSESQTFNLPRIERNHLYKIYIRVMGVKVQLGYYVVNWEGERGGSVAFV